jgi:predicted HTH domain antitoxin
MSHTLTIEYGDDVLLSLGLSDREFSEEARFLLAAKLYELGRLSSGQAAQLCRQTRIAFLVGLSRLGVPARNMKPEDAEVELAFARNA